MGEAHQAEEDHSDWKIGFSRRRALYDVLRQLGFPEQVWPSEAKLNELNACLENFKFNYPRWGIGMESGDVLHKHLAFTLLVPGGKADRARLAVNALSEAGYLVKPPAPRVVAKLIRPWARFHNVKAQRLVHSIRNWDKLAMQVCYPDWNVSPEENIRRINKWIRTNIKGLGSKATAHFMRNTGIWTDEFAFPLIDVHIHKALEKFHFKHDTYEVAEASFWTMAKLFDLGVILLDAVLWCAYANNWEFSHSDFDNYGYNNDKKQ